MKNVFVSREVRGSKLVSTLLHEEEGERISFQKRWIYFRGILLGFGRYKSLTPVGGII